MKFIKHITRLFWKYLIFPILKPFIALLSIIFIDVDFAIPNTPYSKKLKQWKVSNCGRSNGWDIEIESEIVAELVNYNDFGQGYESFKIKFIGNTLLDTIATLPKEKDNYFFLPDIENIKFKSKALNEYSQGNVLVHLHKNDEGYSVSSKYLYVEKPKMTFRNFLK